MIRRLGRVRIAISDSIAIPFSVHIGRLRWIVIPTDILNNANDFRIVVTHEIQHHRQSDTLWAIVIEILQCFCFANPAIYWWKRDIVELQEYSCDQTLINKRGILANDYGNCLLKVAEAALLDRPKYFGTSSLAVVAQNSDYQKSFLRRRIEVFTGRYKCPGSPGAGALLGILMASLTFAVALGTEKSFRKGEGIVNQGLVTVDPQIQAIANKALEAALKRTNAKAGFAIVADPNSGRIMAISNIDTTGKLKDYWALSLVLEPASVVKTLVVAQALESGLTTPDESHNCEKGTYKFGNRVYHDWKKGGWEKLSTTDTIVYSSDICTIKIGERLGVAGIRKMLSAFGFGPNGTASKFPMAKPGLLPPLAQLQHPKIIPYVSAGFGFRVTPLELVQAYGAIANGGKLLMPKTTTESEARPIRQVLTAQNSEKVREILRQVVLKGTGKAAASDKYSMAGKTATSYIPDLTEWDLVEGRRKGNFAGFIGFAPIKEAKVEIYVGLHDPNTDGSGAHGGWHAAPAFKQIAEEVLSHLNVPSDKNIL